MYEDFRVTDRWTGEDLHCEWKGTVVAIATRHADATDIRFAVNGRPVWIAMPNLAWVEQKRRTGYVITDYLAAQTAGRYLQHAIQSGYDNGREMYTMTVDEVLEHANAVVKEAGRTDYLPSLPVINARHTARRRDGDPPSRRTSSIVSAGDWPMFTRRRFLFLLPAFAASAHAEVSWPLRKKKPAPPARLSTSTSAPTPPRASAKASIKRTLTQPAAN